MLDQVDPQGSLIGWILTPRHKSSWRERMVFISDHSLGWSYLWSACHTCNGGHNRFRMHLSSQISGATGNVLENEGFFFSATPISHVNQHLNKKANVPVHARSTYVHSCVSYCGQSKEGALMRVQCCVFFSHTLVHSFIETSA